MKLKKFSIQNFKSIRHISDHVFHDDKINCFIGQNGSGKSNILYALLSLKENVYLTEDSINEDTGLDRDKTILLNAEFALEKEDEDKLKILGYEDVKGFALEVQRTEVGEISRSATPLRYTDIRVKYLKRLAKEILAEIKQFSIELPDATARTDPDGNALTEEALNELVAGLETDKSELDFQIKAAITANTIESYEQLRGEIAAFLIKLDQANVDTSVFKPLADDFSEIVKREISNVLLEIFNSLSINLLDLNYLVEGTAPIKDLSDGKKHPFLFDLLKLSGVPVSEFSPKVGRNLASLQNYSSLRLTSEINKYWRTHGLEYRIERHDGSLCFFFYTKQGAQIELNNLSEGEKWYLKFFVKLAIANNENKKIIWLFDEPGQNLHASSQIDLKNFFEANTKNAQIVYTTHQPMMMQWHRLERLYVVENLESSSEKHKTALSGTTLHQRFWQDSEMVSPLREALGLFIGEELLTGSEHVIVEGISDYFYLAGWLRYFRDKTDPPKWIDGFNENNRTFVPADGRENIPLYCLFLTRKAKKSIRCIAIPDSKDDSETIKKTLEDNGLLNQKEYTKDFSTISGRPDLKDIEELFEPLEFLESVVAHYSVTFPDVKFPKNFTTGYDGKNRIVKYVQSSLKKENPELFSKQGIDFDKTGVAQLVHDSLIWNSSQYSKTAVTNFEKIFIEIDKTFKKKIL